MDSLTAPRIIDSGKGWLAVDKPENMSVHNDPGKDLLSCVSRMIEDDETLARSLGDSKPGAIHPVHRLDRETSGVMLLALDSDTTRWFSRQFEDRSTVKHYRALVHGGFSGQPTKDIFWDWPLSPAAAGRNDPRGKGQKVHCRTQVSVLDQSTHYSLIGCILLTGRKHQIRRHAKLAGHPLVGDSRYNSKRAVDFVRTRCSFMRLGLHALSLEIVLPGENKPRVLCSEMPRVFQRMLDQD